MFVKVHKPVNTPCVCDNKDRCRALVEYLLKESLEDKPYYDTFFSHEEDYVPPVTVMQKIDSNHKKLMKGDDKFYMLSINPSQDEAAHLIRKVTGKQVTEFEQLTVEEQEKVIHELKNYSRNCMDLYAENFRREKIKSGKDLVYFGRVETERHYRNSDEEVKEGQAKSGDRKPGLQLHVHIIVSRNDVTQTVRLSPLARSKGSFNELNGKKVMVGFEHMEWKSRCADRFISMYGYKATHKYYEDGREHTYHYVPGKNEAMSMAKSAILQKEFRNERKMLDVSYRMFRFMVNPKQALIAEAKRLVKDALTGKSKSIYEYGSYVYYETGSPAFWRRHCQLSVSGKIPDVTCPVPAVDTCRNSCRTCHHPGRVVVPASGCRFRTSSSFFQRRDRKRKGRKSPALPSRHGRDNYQILLLVLQFPCLWRSRFRQDQIHRQTADGTVHQVRIRRFHL